MPREGGAFHADRELRDAAQHLERTERGIGLLLAGDHRMEVLEDRIGFGARLSRHGRRHQRRARLGNRASLSLERRLRNPVALEPHPDAHLVAAERIAPLGVPRGVLDLAEVARAPVVLEDRLLVERLEAAVVGRIRGHGTQPCAVRL